jgi:hypothetical protein
VTIWYADFQFWCVVVVLAACLWYLTQIPAWWRGDWRASRIRWRNRAWLPTTVALTAACTITIMMFVVGEGEMPTGLLWFGRLLFIVGGLSILAIPLLGLVPAFDFAVPPSERTETPPPPNRAARRAQSRRAQSRRAQFRRAQSRLDQSRLDQSGRAQSIPAQARRAPRIEPPVPNRTAIRFHRPGIRFKDRFRAYRLEIDGEPVGEVRHGGELTIVTTPGTWTLRARIDWMASAPLTVTVRSGHTVTVLVEPGDVSGLDALQPREGYLRLSVDAR